MNCGCSSLARNLLAEWESQIAGKTWAPRKRTADEGSMPAIKLPQTTNFDLSANLVLLAYSDSDCHFPRHYRSSTISRPLLGRWVGDKNCLQSVPRKVPMADSGHRLNAALNFKSSKNLQKIIFEFIPFVANLCDTLPKTNWTFKLLLEKIIQIIGSSLKSLAFSTYLEAKDDNSLDALDIKISFLPFLHRSRNKEVWLHRQTCCWYKGLQWN